MCSQAVGHIIIGEPVQTLNLIAAALVRQAMTYGVDETGFWPLTIEGKFEGFQQSCYGSSQWPTDFGRFLEQMSASGASDTRNPGTHFAVDVLIDGQAMCSENTGPFMVFVCDKLSVMISSFKRCPVQYLDIPWQSVADVQALEMTVPSARKRVADVPVWALFLRINIASRVSYYLNSAKCKCKEIRIILASEDDGLALSEAVRIRKGLSDHGGELSKISLRRMSESIEHIELGKPASSTASEASEPSIGSQNTGPGNPAGIHHEDLNHHQNPLAETADDRQIMNALLSKGDYTNGFNGNPSHEIGQSRLQVIPITKSSRSTGSNESQFDAGSRRPGNERASPVGGNSEGQPTMHKIGPSEREHKPREAAAHSTTKHIIPTANDCGDTSIYDFPASQDIGNKESVPSKRPSAAKEFRVGAEAPQPRSKKAAKGPANESTSAHESNSTRQVSAEKAMKRTVAGETLQHSLERLPLKRSRRAAAIRANRKIQGLDLSEDKNITQPSCFADEKDEDESPLIISQSLAQKEKVDVEREDSPLGPSNVVVNSEIGLENEASALPIPEEPKRQSGSFGSQSGAEVAAGPVQDQKIGAEERPNDIPPSQLADIKNFSSISEAEDVAHATEAFESQPENAIMAVVNEELVNNRSELESGERQEPSSPFFAGQPRKSRKMDRFAQKVKIALGFLGGSGSDMEQPRNISSEHGWAPKEADRRAGKRKALADSRIGTSAKKHKKSGVDQSISLPAEPSVQVSKVERAVQQSPGGAHNLHGAAAARGEVHLQAAPAFSDERLTRKPPLISFNRSGPRNQGAFSAVTHSRNRKTANCNPVRKLVFSGSVAESHFGDTGESFPGEPQTPMYPAGRLERIVPLIDEDVLLRDSSSHSPTIVDFVRSCSSAGVRVTDEGSPIPTTRYAEKDQTKTNQPSGTLEPGNQSTGIIGKSPEASVEGHNPGQRNVHLTGGPSQIPVRTTPTLIPALPDHAAHRVKPDGTLVNVLSSTNVRPLHHQLQTIGSAHKTKIADTVFGGKDLSDPEPEHFLQSKQGARGFAVPSREDPEKTLINEDPSQDLLPSTSDLSTIFPSSQVTSSSSPSRGEEERSQPTKAWRDALKTHQNGYYEALLQVVGEITQNLVDEEAAINDSIIEYHRRGMQLVEGLADAHRKQRAEMIVRLEQEKDAQKEAFLATMEAAKTGMGLTRSAFLQVDCGQKVEAHHSRLRGHLGTLSGSVGE
ncbi:MAG: hypothetical protein M1819_003656 [Sarea resinae]|nr:MAG: hypothetical protein M1819_003656 [Sarea resinae]